MLTKLLPDQISKFWPIIKHSINESLPPIVGSHVDRMNNILSGALSGKIDVWASYVRKDGLATFDGIMLTKPLFDDVSMTRNLLIYCLCSFRDIPKESWIGGIGSLLKYANKLGCASIIAYTELPGIVNIAQRLGGEAKYTYISFDVKELLARFQDESNH